jgi:GNAT superfamily N-acetyltransferase
MKITSLENIPISEIVTAFNLSFSDYIIPLQLTEQQFRDKLFSEDIHLEWSFGAFEGNRLVGFVLHGVRNNALYNAGTGVIPEYRGNKITQKLYDCCLEKAKTENIRSIQLEVITGNSSAIKAYENIGFEIIRTLNCYKGTLSVEDSKSSFEILELGISECNAADALCNYLPTWQNSIETIKNLYKINDIKIIGVMHQAEMIGYAIFNNTSKKILQVGISENHDRNALRNALFEFISAQYSKEVFAINIDDSAKNTISGLNSLGLNCFLQQFEMKMELNKKA